MNIKGIKRLFALSVLTGIIGISSCYNDKADKLYPAPPISTCDTTTITFAHDIMPILNASCNVSGGCHDASGATTSGFDFTTYAGIQSQATYAILVNDINFTPTSRHHEMPKSLPKISQCDINKITRWVNLGSLNN